jgi:hypothetical protein
MSPKSKVQSPKSQGESLKSTVQRLVSKRLRLQSVVWNPRASGPELKRSLLILHSLLLVSISIFSLSACGRKTDVRPPELVAPEPVGDLTLEVTDTGIQLRWGRPQKYVDGSDMDDLGGFVVLRETQNGQGKEGAFAQLATVPVEDRDRFRKAKKFSYTDEQLTAGTLYRYRVEAFTLDGYHSSPSNTVELVWQKGP